MNTQLFWSDTKTLNSRSYLVSVDYGFNDAWCASIMWDDDGVYFYTQYEPEILCSDNPCLHLPQRCHFDNYEVTWITDEVIL